MTDPSHSAQPLTLRVRKDVADSELRTDAAATKRDPVTVNHSDTPRRIQRLPSTGDRPQHSPTRTGLPEGMVAGGATDSAGFPWAGRSFTHHETAFADDDGTVPEHYAAAVAQLREAAAAVRGNTQPERSEELLATLASAHAKTLAALAESRVLIPLVAEAGELGTTPEGKIVEKTQELSIVTVTAPDGRTVMPVFSSVAAMQTWDATARPIPVPAPQAAIAAAQEQTDLLIVDPGTQDMEFGVRRTELEAVALRQAREPAWANPDVNSAVTEAARSVDGVQTTLLLPGDPEARLLAEEVEIAVFLVTGLQRSELRERVAEFRRLLGENEAVAALVDSVRVRVIAS